MIQGVSEYKTRVLVVEMDPMCRRVVERILGNSCKITTSCDFDEIKFLLEKGDFDTLFVDNDFPSPGAIYLFETARQRAPHTRRVLMTGENVTNLQYYLNIGLIDACVTRTTSGKNIEKEVICRAASS
jgi:DNA-binding NtrC family response regulator